MKRWWKNDKISVRSEECPGVGFVLGRITFKRMSPTPETRKKMSRSNSGKISPMRGKRHTEKTRKKMSLSAKARVERLGLPVGSFQKGNISIISKEARKRASDKQRGQKRSGKYVSHKRWHGKGNPWFGKTRSGKNHPRYNPERRNRHFIDWMNSVKKLTEETYVKYANEINPNNFPRTLSGVEGGYQLDHIISKNVGYKMGLSPEEVSKKENLQMLPWLHNLLKSDKSK